MHGVEVVEVEVEVQASSRENEQRAADTCGDEHVQNIRLLTAGGFKHISSAPHGTALGPSRTARRRLFEPLSELGVGSRKDALDARQPRSWPSREATAKAVRDGDDCRLPRPGRRFRDWCP